MSINLPSKSRFIPLMTQDLMVLCQQEVERSQIKEHIRFTYLAELLSSTFHFEFHRQAVALKQTYAPIDPDRDTIKISDLDYSQDFIHLLKEVLNQANYEPISKADLNKALEESSLFKIQLAVDFDDFDEVLLFCRGEHEKSEEVSTWFGLKKKTVEFTNYERVVVYFKFKDFDEKNILSQAGYRSGSRILKLFQNVPKADLEMLFPNTRVEMRTIDKLLIGVPAAISGGIVLTTKLGASLLILASLIAFTLGLREEPVTLDQTALLALFGGLAALGGYLWKQFNNFKNRKLKFMQTLTQNLYFKNLDNNAGVFLRLLDEAEDEEVKEAMLAYCFLLTSEQPLSKLALDETIERFLKKELSIDIDFEIDDALNKLHRFNLVKGSPEALEAVPIGEAISHLDNLWDDYFSATDNLKN